MSTEKRIIEKDIERCAENTDDTVVTTKTTGVKWKIIMVLICMILFGLSGLYYYQKHFELEKFEKKYQECENDVIKILNLYCDIIKNQRLTKYLKDKHDITKMIDNYLGDRSIFDAVTSNYYENELLLKLFILERKVSVDSVDHGDIPLLILATRSYSSEIVKLLIDFGADLNATDKNNSATALHHACDLGHNETVKLLIDTDKCDLNMQDNLGFTPLHVACSNGHKETVQLLIDTGSKCNLNMQDNFGDTPLHVAAVKVFEEIFNILLKAGANENIKNKNEETPKELLRKIKSLFEKK